jgi:hypothetical protein
MALPEGPTFVFPDIRPNAVESQTSQPIFHRRPIQREGARYFLSAAEQAMEDAMLRSSPSPEIVLGKRTRQGDDDHIDTEPDEDPLLAPQESLRPSVSNVADASRRYALKKKLRPEQRDEVDAFLLVSAPTFILGACLNIGQDTALGRQAKLFACIMSLENKVDAFRLAAPPYQLSDELKVCNITVLFLVIPPPLLML